MCSPLGVYRWPEQNYQLDQHDGSFIAIIHYQASTNMEYSIPFHISFNTEAIRPRDMDNMEWPDVWCQFTMCSPRHYRAVKGLQ
jgi:hypothetical protein